MSVLSTSGRRWFVPEVIQTSSMDCGPAVLKSVLEGHGISASYSHLREACQTSVDGTSVDEMESVIQRLGLCAEQVVLPADSLWDNTGQVFPSVAVTSDSNGVTHFVVLWRRVGQWLQIMDPGVGRKWLRINDFKNQLYPFSTQVDSADWLEWANSEEAMLMIRGRLCLIGAPSSQVEHFLEKNINRNSSIEMASLDAAIRLLHSLQEAGGLQGWRDTKNLLCSLIDRVRQNPSALFQHIPERFWSAKCSGGEGGQIVLNGVVLLRITGNALEESGISPDEEQAVFLEPELVSALDADPIHPMKEFWHLVRQEGLLTPLTMILAIGLAMSAVVLEAVLFRALLDMGNSFDVTSQRLMAVAGFMIFVLLLWLYELSIVSESLRAGRHLEARIRALLMSRLPALKDRYMQSRLVSDVAERCHSVYMLRDLPELAVSFMRASWELLFTIIAIGIIAPASLPFALLIGVLTITTMYAAKPVLSEGELRVRSHLGSLQKFYFDALLGCIPIRTHSAERAIRREHEGLLVEWARSAKRILFLSVAVEGVRSLLTWLISGCLLFFHIMKFGVTGDLLLLVYWTLKLPSLGEKLVSALLQYPAQRSVGMRLLEVVRSTPEQAEESDSDNDVTLSSPVCSASVHGSSKSSAIAIEMCNAHVVAGGHDILKHIDVSIAAGEHVAIVGPSGAGKSSLIGILLGFHEAYGNAVLVDGEPLTNGKLESLRRHTSWVDPAVQIWNRSLLENLRYSPSSGTHSELGAVLDASELTEVVAHLPDGFQSVLGEGGAKLSGGEAQRVRLARAMWQSDIGLVLLDEPFRGLDKGTRQKHLATVRRHWADATMLCITHDIAETSAFDRVLVLEAGHIVEDGSPSDLKQREGSRYSELLNIERSVHQKFWSQASTWRRLTLQEGKVQESKSVALP